MNLQEAIEKVSREYKDSQELHEDIAKIQQTIRDFPNGQYLLFPKYKLDILEEVLDHNRIPAIRLSNYNYFVVAETLSKAIIYNENIGI